MWYYAKVILVQINLIIAIFCYIFWNSLSLRITWFIFNISTFYTQYMKYSIFYYARVNNARDLSKEFLSDLSNQSTFISYFPPLHFKVRTWRTTMWWNQINGLLWQMNFSISVVYVLLLKLYFDDYHLNLTFSLCLSLKRGRREQSEVTFESCNCSYETFKLLSFLFWRWLKIPHNYIKIKRYGNFV